MAEKNEEEEMPRTPAATMAADPERAAHGAVAHLARPGASAVSAAVCSDKPILFLDFEASSLTAGSWPVEIGYARIADGRVVVEAALIAPEAAWSMDDWSEASARLHGLSIEAVRCGRPAAEIAARTDRFRDFLVVSDNPAWDQWWLDRLRSGRPPIVVHDLRGLAAVASRRRPPTSSPCSSSAPTAGIVRARTPPGSPARGWRPPGGRRSRPDPALTPPPT